MWSKANIRIKHCKEGWRTKSVENGKTGAVRSLKPLNRTTWNLTWIIKKNIKNKIIKQPKQKWRHTLVETTKIAKAKEDDAEEKCWFTWLHQSHSNPQDTVTISDANQSRKWCKFLHKHSRYCRKTMEYDSEDNTKVQKHISTWAFNSTIPRVWTFRHRPGLADRDSTATTHWVDGSAAWRVARLLA